MSLASYRAAPPRVMLGRHVLGRAGLLILTEKAAGSRGLRGRQSLSDELWIRIDRESGKTVGRVNVAGRKGRRKLCQANNFLLAGWEEDG